MTARANTTEAPAARRGIQRIFLLSPADCGGRRARLIVGKRLHLPPQLIGLGDMSRGSLLLRCAADSRELDYVSIADVDARKLPPRVRKRL